mgnify:CR=1 FL=1
MSFIPAPFLNFDRYKLFLTKGDFFLLSARKRMKIKTSNYIISLDEDDISMKTGNYFGNVSVLLYFFVNRKQIIVFYLVDNQLKLGED